MTVSHERKVAKMQEYILEDRRVTVENVAELFSISYGTAQDIISNKLGMRRVSARWVPRLLIPEQMVVRVKMCNEYCRQYYDEGDIFLNRVVTCDETWIHFFEPESKQQSSVWKHPSSPSPIKALISKSAGKVMAIIFCDIQGIILNHFVPPKTTVAGNYYATVNNMSCCRRLKESAHTLRGLGLCCTMITHQVTAAVYCNGHCQQTRYRTLTAPTVQPRFSDLATSGYCQISKIGYVKINTSPERSSGVP